MRDVSIWRVTPALIGLSLISCSCAAVGCTGALSLNLNSADTFEESHDGAPQSNSAAQSSASDKRSDETPKPPPDDSESTQTAAKPASQAPPTSSAAAALDRLLEASARPRAFDTSNRPLVRKLPPVDPPAPLPETIGELPLDIDSALPITDTIAEPAEEEVALAAATGDDRERAEVSPVDKPAPPQTWREQLNGAIATLERDLARANSDDTERARLEAKVRLLYLAGDQNEQAFRWIKQLQPSEQDYVANLLESWRTFFDPQGPPDPRARAALAGRALRDAEAHLAAASKLDLRNLTFCQRVDGYGQYEPFEQTSGQHQFKPNQEVLLYVEIENFAAEENRAGLFETELEGSYYITPLGGGARVDDQQLPLDKQSSRRYRRDYYLPYRIYVPKDIERGQYLLQLQIKDVKGQKFGNGVIEFSVR